MQSYQQTNNVYPKLDTLVNIAEVGGSIDFITLFKFHAEISNVNNVKSNYLEQLITTNIPLHVNVHNNT